MKVIRVRSRKKSFFGHSIPMLALLGVLAIALVGLELSQKSSVSVLGPIVPGPLTGYTFAIDPGHGGEDGGAVGPSGTLEARLNLSVAGYLAEELRSRGANIILTRENDDALAEGKMEDLRKRREILTSEGLTASISVHMNKHTKPDANGPRLFYCQGSEVGKALATLVLHNIEDALGRKQTAPFVGDYFVIKGEGVPCILVECGFLSNPSDEALLLTEDHQRLLARCIADGLEDYFTAQENLPSMTYTLTAGP